MEAHALSTRQGRPVCRLRTSCAVDCCVWPQRRWLLPCFCALSSGTSCAVDCCVWPQRRWLLPCFCALSSGTSLASLSAYPMCVSLMNPPVPAWS